MTLMTPKLRYSSFSKIWSNFIFNYTTINCKKKTLIQLIHWFNNICIFLITFKHQNNKYVFQYKDYKRVNIVHKYPSFFRHITAVLLICCCLTWCDAVSVPAGPTWSSIRMNTMCGWFFFVTPGLSLWLFRPLCFTMGCWANTISSLSKMLSTASIAAGGWGGHRIFTGALQGAAVRCQSIKNSETDRWTGGQSAHVGPILQPFDLADVREAFQSVAHWQ